MKILATVVLGGFLGGCAAGGDAANNPGDAADGTGGATGASGGSTGIQDSELAIYSSGSRIKMRVGTTPDGAKQFLGWRDTTLNVNCSFTAIGGQKLCVPDGLASANFFTDSACAQVAIVSLGAASTCASPAATAVPQALFAAQLDCLSQTKAIFSVGPAIANPAKSYFLSGTTCLDFTAAAVANGYSFRQLGASVPFSQFAGLTESIQ